MSNSESDGVAIKIDLLEYFDRVTKAFDEKLSHTEEKHLQLLESKVSLLERELRAITEEYKKSEILLANTHQELIKRLAEMNNERDRSDKQVAKFVSIDDMENKVALRIAQAIALLNKDMDLALNDKLDKYQLKSASSETYAALSKDIESTKKAAGSLNDKLWFLITSAALALLIALIAAIRSFT